MVRWQLDDSLLKHSIITVFLNSRCYYWKRILGDNTYLLLLWVQGEFAEPNCGTSQWGVAPGCSAPGVVAGGPPQAAAPDAILLQELLLCSLKLSQEQEPQQSAAGTAETLVVKPVVSGAELPAPALTLHSLPLSLPVSTISINTPDMCKHFTKTCDIMLHGLVLYSNS
jgi:hypothetical protein